MLRYLLVLFVFSTCTLCASEQKKTVCLNMIVKDETNVIRRCLESVKPLIDYWVIVDTGSTDGTQQMIKEYMKDIPGELHETPWVNFAYNRTDALQHARGKADYLLFIDADETFVLEPNFQLPDLDKDFYYIVTHYGGTHYDRIQLINNHLSWAWVGVLHESIECNGARTSGVLNGIYNYVRSDGARAQDPNKFQKDIKILETALKDDPNNRRYQFYLAQTYREAGEYVKAEQQYQKRIAMGGFDQEIFWSLYQLGHLQQSLQRREEEIAKAYLAAYSYRPTRAEPLYHLANYYRTHNNCRLGYEFAKKALVIAEPSDLLFVEHWVYDYGILLEFSISAYWTEQYVDALLASNLILSKPDLPANVRDCVKKNLVCIKEALINGSPEKFSKIFGNSDDCSSSVNR